MERGVLTTREAANLLQLPERTVRELCRRGQLSGAWQEYGNGPWHIPATSVEKWLSQSSSEQLEGEGSLAPPTAWQRFRFSPWIFYPTIVFGIILTTGTFLFAAISAGADLGSANRLLLDWGLVNAFRPASENETLIIVSQFHSPESIPNTEPHLKIKRAILTQASRLNFAHVRAEVDPRPLGQDDTDKAEQVAANYHAAMIIWGEDTGVEFIVRFRTPAESRAVYGEFQLVETGEAGRTLYARPGAYAALITQELPSLSTFLSFLVIGITSIDREQYHDAILSLEAAIEAAEQVSPPPSGTFEQILSAAYTNLSLAKVLAGEQEADLDGALVALDKALNLDSKNVAAYVNRGVLYTRLGAYYPAIDDYSQAISIDPLNSSAYVNRGVAYTLRGQYEAALSDLNRAIAVAPNNGVAYVNRGIAYSRLGQLEDAAGDYGRAIALDPSNSDAYRNRGITYASQAQYAEALNNLQYALSLSQETGDRLGEVAALNGIGGVYHATGQYDEALDNYEQALAIATEVGDEAIARLIVGNKWDTLRASGGLEEIVASVGATAVATVFPSTPTPTNPTTELGKGPETITIGVTALGTPIEAVRFGNGETKLVFVGGLHAGFAPSTVDLAQEAIAYFTNNPEDIPEKLTLFIVPLASPDTRYHPGVLSGRLNSRGVDPNRNWDCRWTSDPEGRGEVVPGIGGAAPFSEQESQALRDFILDVGTTAVVFWEARASNGLVTPGGCSDNSLASANLAHIYGLAAGYAVSEFDGLGPGPTTGGASDWLDSMGIPAIAVFLSDYTYAPGDWEDNLRGIHAVLETYGD